MLRQIDAAQLRWLGHLEGMDEGRIAKGRRQWAPSGNRPRGTSRKRWRDAVKEILDGYNMTEIEELRTQGTMQDQRE